MERERTFRPVKVYSTHIFTDCWHAKQMLDREGIQYIEKREESYKDKTYFEISVDKNDENRAYELLKPIIRVTEEKTPPPGSLDKTVFLR